MAEPVPFSHRAAHRRFEHYGDFENNVHGWDAVSEIEIQPSISVPNEPYSISKPPPDGKKRAKCRICSLSAWQLLSE